MDAGPTLEQWTLVASAVIAGAAVVALILNAVVLRQTRRALSLDRARTAADIASRDPGLSVRLWLCAYGYDLGDNGELSGPAYGEILIKSHIDVFVHRVTVLEVQIGHPRVAWTPANAVADPALGAYEFQSRGSYPVQLHESEEQWFFWPQAAQIPRENVASVPGLKFDPPGDMGHYKVRLEVLFGYEASSRAYLVSRRFTFDVRDEWHGDNMGNLPSPDG